MSILGDLQKQNGGAWVELYELDATAQGGSVLYFHAGTNGLNTSVVWQSNTYVPFPINATGFEISGQQMPRPKLAVANVSGAITALLQTSDLLGAKVTRRRTMVKYLDAANFPARRNLLTHTENFSNAIWTKYNVAILQNDIIAPDGNNTGIKITSTANTVCLIESYATVPASATADYYPTIRVKRGNTPAVTLNAYYSGNAEDNVTFNFDTGQVLNEPFTGEHIFQSLGNGWYKIGFRMNRDATGTKTIILHRLWNTSRAEAVINDYCYAWGAQLEAGAISTEYQPVGASWSANPTADANAHLADEIYYIAQKTQENHAIVEFELGSPIDLEGVTIPRRQIVANLCLWQYRGDGCGYAGGAVADEFDVPTAVLANDKCSKRLSGCTLRFGSNSELPYGGFPSAGLTKL